MRDAQVRDLEDEDRIGAAACRRRRNNRWTSVATERTRTLLELEVMVGRCRSSFQPRSTNLMLGSGRLVKRVERAPVHGDDVGQDRRLDVVVVVGCHAHELRALDQEGRVAHIVDADLAFLQRGQRTRRRDDVLGDHSPRWPGKDFGHLGLRLRRGALRQSLRGQRRYCNHAKGKKLDVPLRSPSLYRASEWIAQKPRKIECPSASHMIVRGKQKLSPVGEGPAGRKYRERQPGSRDRRSGAPCWLIGFRLKMWPRSG